MCGSSLWCSLLWWSLLWCGLLWWCPVGTAGMFTPGLLAVCSLDSRSVDMYGTLFGGVPYGMIPDEKSGLLM